MRRKVIIVRKSKNNDHTCTTKCLLATSCAANLIAAMLSYQQLTRTYYQHVMQSFDRADIHSKIVRFESELDRSDSDLFTFWYRRAEILCNGTFGQWV